MPHHQLLLEFALAAPIAILAAVGAFLIRDVRLLGRCTHPCSHNSVVAHAETVLLPERRNRLPHSTTPSRHPNDASSNAASNAAANAATHCPSSTGNTATSWRPLQLRSGHSGQLAGRQKGVVLQGAPCWLPTPNRTSSDAGAVAGAATSTHLSSSACRPIQLRRWFRQLAKRMGCWKEGMVLQGSWKGLPRAGSRLRPHCCNPPSLRLQCWLCQLDGRVECAQEGFLLPQRRQGLPAGSWRLCMKAHTCRRMVSERWLQSHLPALVSNMHC